MLRKIKINKPIFLLSFFFSIMLLFSSKIVIGDIFSTKKESYVKNFNILDIFKFILLVIITYIILYFITCLLSKIRKYNDRKPNKKLFFVILILFLLLWLPYILTYYPGGLFADTYYSIEMALHQRGMDNHHPILYTLIWKLLLTICKNHNLSIFLFTILQYLFMGIVCSSIIYYMYRRGYNKKITIISFLFFGLFPLIPLYIISLWKDTPFSIWILVYSFFLLLMMNRNDFINSITSKKNTIILIIISFFVAFSRNNGIYIVFLTNLSTILLLLKKEKSKQVKIFSIINILNIAFIFIIQGPIYNKLGLNSDKSIESLSIPFQQVAYISSEEELDKSDKEFLNTIIPLDVLKNNYTPMNIDTLKFNKDFNLDYFDSNVSKFMKLYFKLTIKYPDKAIKAYVLQTVGFWDIKETSSVGYIQNEMWNEEPYKMKDQFENLFGFSIKNVLNPKILINYAIFIWIMLYTIVFLIYKKRKKLIVSLMPNLLVWLTIMVATPIGFSLRYVFSIVLSFPLYLICLSNNGMNLEKDCKDN